MVPMSHTVLTMAVCALSLSAHWAFMFWFIQHLRKLPGVLDWSDSQKTRFQTLAMVLVMLASILGNYLAGAIARWLGYRRTIVLMLLGTAWFVWNVNQEPIADFSAFKPYMMAGFVAIGVLSCVFVQDFLAVRGLAVVLLLLGKCMADTGRMHLGESPFVLVIQGWAYVLVVAGIWFTITPWKLRDFIAWATATEGRTRRLSAVRLAFATFVLVLGLTAFRTM